MARRSRSTTITRNPWPGTLASVRSAVDQWMVRPGDPQVAERLADASPALLALIERLRLYAVHRPDCDRSAFHKRACSCGLDRLLAVSR